MVTKITQNNLGASFFSMKIHQKLRISKIIRYPKLMLLAFVMEGIETKNMLQTFVKEGKGRLLLSDEKEMPTEEEMEQAVGQLKDMPKFLPFFILAIAPVPGVTEGYCLLAITLERWLGSKVSLLPTHFRRVFQKEIEKVPDTEEEPLPTE